MSSLPILSSQTPSNGKIDAGKPGHNAPGAEDLANGSAPFGELLAKQLGPQGRDLRSALMKTLAATDGDTSAADAGAPFLQPADGLRADGVAIPSDLLASLMHKDSRMARNDAAEAAGTAASPVTVLRDAATRDPAARSGTNATVDGSKPEPQLSSDKTGRQVDAQEARDARAARSGPAPDTAFAAALQAEKKAGLPATGKTDSAIQPALTAGTTAPAIGMPNAPSNAPQPAATQATIATPLHQAQWADDFSQKVTWIATQRSQSAELHLNPAQLGPLEVSLKLNGDQATLQFTSAHAAVREAIEQSIPRLRDMLADSGISLGNTTVSDQAPREQQQRGQAGTNGTRNTDNAPESDASQIHTTALTSRHDGMVDTFV
jgi:flagellar hook-length control protein FliK